MQTKSAAVVGAGYANEGDGAMEAHEALEVLRRVVEKDQQEWRERYDRLAQEHAELEERFDAVRKTLASSPVARALAAIDQVTPADDDDPSGEPHTASGTDSRGG